MKEEKHAKKRNKNKSNAKSHKDIKLEIEEVDLENMMRKKKEDKKEKKEKKSKKRGNENHENDKNKKTKEKKKSKKAAKIAIVIIIILLTIGGVFGYNVWKNGGGAKGIVATVAGGKDEKKLKDLPPLQFLLLGKSEYMTDTIMVFSYNPKTQEGAMLSIPRDTYIGNNKENARASEKINSRYQLGIDKTLKAVNRVTGMKVEYYVVVDTKALIKLVDAMGGVEFDVPIDMNYDDDTQDLHIHLKAGLQKLNGAQAEQVVRFRHNNNGSSYSKEYGDQDIGRMRTQREFLQAAFKQFFNISNILNINKFIDIAESSIETNMDFNVLKDYVPYAVDFKTDSLVTAVLPGRPELCNKVWVYIVNKREAKETITNLFGEEAIKTSIQDGSTGNKPVKPVEKPEKGNNTINNTITNTVPEKKPGNTISNNTINKPNNNVINNNTIDKGNGSNKNEINSNTVKPETKPEEKPSEKPEPDKKPEVKPEEKPKPKPDTKPEPEQKPSTNTNTIKPPKDEGNSKNNTISKNTNTTANKE